VLSTYPYMKELEGEAVIHEPVGTPALDCTKELLSLQLPPSLKYTAVTTNPGVNFKPTMRVLSMVGKAVGVDVGEDDVGMTVGWAVGSAVGDQVGIAVGSAVGEVLGAGVGARDGSVDGTALGCALGDAVGNTVGGLVKDKPAVQLYTNAFTLPRLFVVAEVPVVLKDGKQLPMAQVLLLPMKLPAPQLLVL
jgi:hypothetical protein